VTQIQEKSNSWEQIDIYIYIYIYIYNIYIYIYIYTYKYICIFVYIKGAESKDESTCDSQARLWLSCALLLYPRRTTRPGPCASTTEGGTGIRTVVAAESAAAAPASAEQV